MIWANTGLRFYEFDRIPDEEASQAAYPSSMPCDDQAGESDRGEAQHLHLNRRCSRTGSTGGVIAYCCSAPLHAVQALGSTEPVC